MRRVLLLALLLGLSACTIREEAFAPGRDEAPGGLSLAPPNPNVPIGEDADVGCPGGFAKRSVAEEVRRSIAQLVDLGDVLRLIAARRPDCRRALGLSSLTTPPASSTRPTRLFDEDGTDLIANLLISPPHGQ